MTTSQTTPWAVVTVRMKSVRSTREAWAETLDRLDEVGALLAADAGVGGVELRDPRTIDGPERPELIVYTTPEALESVATTVRTTVEAFGIDHAEVSADVRTDDDWRDTWKQFYRPMQLGDGALLLRPSWIPRQDGDPEREIVLDPGRAFGTGLHETTQLCIDRICALASAAPSATAPDRILDLGCGSGILALCAARLFESATRVVAIDEDPEATDTTIENAELNGLVARVEVRTGDVEDAAARGPYDLVLANIRAHTLVPRAAAIHACTAAGGRVVLSGVLVEELEEVEAAYLAAGFVRDPDVAWPRTRNIWVALDLVRPR